MRATIEIPDKHRAKLLALAAERGEEGFSGIIAEVLDVYFKLQAKPLLLTKVP